MKYPVFIASKGRWELCKTADLLVEDKADFRIVVEKDEAEKYAVKYGMDRLVIMPGNNYGDVSYPRNFSKDLAAREGHKYFWTADDNILGAKLYRPSKQHPSGQRLATSLAGALDFISTFVDGYKNIGLAAPAYSSYGFDKPYRFEVNKQVSSCFLVLTDMPFRFRPKTFEDVDYTFQVLTAGYCTVLFWEYQIHKAASGLLKGGSTDTIYKEWGRLKMWGELRRLWPAYIKRYEMHNGKLRARTSNIWKLFNQRLERCDDAGEC